MHTSQAQVNWACPLIQGFNQFCWVQPQAQEDWQLMWGCIAIFNDLIVILINQRFWELVSFFILKGSSGFSKSREVSTINKCIGDIQRTIIYYWIQFLVSFSSRTLFSTIVSVPYCLIPWIWSTPSKVLVYLITDIMRFRWSCSKVWDVAVTWIWGSVDSVRDGVGFALGWVGIY